MTDHPAEPQRGPGPVSHRSAETTDPVIADLAAATGWNQLESGAPAHRAGAIARPLNLTDANLLHGPWIAMLAALGLVLVLAWRPQLLDRPRGLVLLVAYPVLLLALAIT